MNEGKPMPNLELRGYYRVAAFFIFGELMILWGCSYISTPDNRWLAIVTGTVSYLVFLAMIVQTEVSQMQWLAMREQARIASQQFELTDRPWLSVSVQIISPLTFDEQGAHLRFLIVGKNVGRSVAVSASIHAHLIAPRLGGDVFKYIHEKQAEIGNNFSPIMTDALFPGDTHPHDIHFTISQQELEDVRFMETDILQLYLVGCANYQLSGHEPYHQTGFVFEILRIEPPHAGTFGLSIGKDVGLDVLILRKPIVGTGNFAT